MYGHGFASLFLAEVYGMTGNSKLRPILKNALRLMELSQKKDGGWNYYANRNGVGDNSITVAQVMAMRAAKEAGFYVNPKVLKAAIASIKRSCLPGGGFTYNAVRIGGTASGSTTYARAGSGASTLLYAGQYDAKETKRSVEWIRKHMKEARRAAYGIYYVSQTMFQAGLKKPKYWTDYYTWVKDHIIKSQRVDGSMLGGSGGQVYNTAVGVLILDIPNRYMPIFER
jgi:hypothetical protein